jgi:hypothetical protein
MINVPTDGMVALEDPHTPFQIRADAALADGQFNASAVFDIPLVQLRRPVAPRDARATRADGARRSSNVRTRVTPAGQAIVHASARVRSRAAAPFSDSHPVRDGVA